jgi:hypothetical protein
MDFITQSVVIGLTEQAPLVLAALGFAGGELVWPQAGAWPGLGLLGAGMLIAAGAVMLDREALLAGEIRPI